MKYIYSHAPKCNVVRLFFCGLIFAACLFVSCGPLLDIPGIGPEPEPLDPSTLVVVPLRTVFGDQGDKFDPTYPANPDPRQLAVYRKAIDGNMTRLKTGEFSVTLTKETSMTPESLPYTFPDILAEMGLPTVQYAVSVTSGALEGSPYFIEVRHGLPTPDPMMDILIVVPHKQSYYLDYKPDSQNGAIDEKLDLSVFFFDAAGVLTVLNPSDFNLTATHYNNEGKFDESGTQVVTVTYPAQGKTSDYSVEVITRQTLNAPSLTLNFPLALDPLQPGIKVPTQGHVQTGYRVNPPGVGTRPIEYEIWYLEGDANVAHIKDPLYPDPSNPRSPIRIQGSVLHLEGLLENIYGQWDSFGNGIFTGRDIYFVVVGKRPNWEPGVSAPVLWRPLAGDIIWLPERLPPADTGYWTFTYLDGDGNSVYDPSAPAIKDQTTSEAPHPEGSYGPAGYYTIKQTGVTVIGKNFGKVIKIPSSAGELNVTLNNAEINSLTGGALKYSPLMIGDRASGSPADVTITLRGDNVLRTLKNNRTEEDYNGRAGLGVDYNSSVTITGTGSLTAIGGGRAAGIGGWADIDGGANNCGEITISSGNVYAFGGSGAAGIGAGAVKNQSTINGKPITIEGGVVYAFGGPAHYDGATLYSAGGAGIGASSTLISPPVPVIFNGDITIKDTAVVYAFGGSQARGVDSSTTMSLAGRTALFTFRGVKEGYSSSTGALSNVDVTAVPLTHTGGLLFYDTTGTLEGAAELRRDIVIPPASLGDWDNFWNYSLGGKYIFPEAARAELKFRSSSSPSSTDFAAAYPNLTWQGDFHHWNHPVYNPPHVTGPYQLDLAGKVLNLQGNTIGIVPKGALEFMDSARPQVESKDADSAARGAMPVPADWTGPNEKRLLNRDTPTTGYVKNGTILGFNRKGYNNGPNLLPSPGYFFRDKLYYPPPPPLAPPYLPGMAFPAEAVYNWGSDEPYCGYVDYTGQEDNYNYSKTHTPDDASYKPRVGVTDPILPGFVEIPGFMSRNVSEAEGKGYKFFDEIWGPETSDARPDFEFFCTPNTDNWNIFAFLVEELGRDSYPAEGIFNRRLKDMNLQIPGVYPWSN